MTRPLIGRPWDGSAPWKYVDGEIRSFSPYEPVGRTIAIVMAQAQEHGPMLAAAPALAEALENVLRQCNNAPRDCHPDHPCSGCEPGYLALRLAEEQP